MAQTKLTEKQLAHFKDRLLAEKKRIEDDRAAYVRDNMNESEEESGETSVAGNAHGDVASNLFDRERDRAATENMDRLLAKIERALVKMDEGTYGLSDIDGTPIPPARLEIAPYAVTTVEQEDAAF